MNTIRTKAKDLIFYDSLENYKINGETVDGDPLGDEYTSDWHGTLTGIDVSQMVAMGAKPVIYLSRIANLVFLNNDVGDLPDLTDTSVWQTMDQFGDISEAKAIAIDLRKKADSTDFVLDRGESAIAILQMKAPAGASSSYTRVPVSFNNIYISDTVIDLFDNEIEKYIHHDYTQIQFVVKGDITIHKTSEKDGYPIKGIKFRLRGTSDYGDEIDTFAASNRKGLLTFADIPKGTYILSEYEGIPDYQEDHTEMMAQIDDTGKVWFTDKTGTRSEITNSQAEITNKPRIHADVHIIKRDNARKGTVIPNVTFKLSGISDYGNDVVMVATTDEGGKLVFENLEQGTYELIELEAPEGYINDGRKYEVTVDQNGNVSVTGAEIEELDDTEVYNAKYAVALYGICLDEDDSGEQMGLTFGPALGADYTISFVSHTPSGKTSSGNDKRCIHNDTWDEIIEWNFKDPYVYEDCIATGCKHSVHLDLTKAEDNAGNKLFNTTSNFLDTNSSDNTSLQAKKRNGDGPSQLFYELMPTNSNYENVRWNPVGSNGTNSGGWGASRIRAMLNGADDKTTLTDSSQSSDVHKSASVYTEDNCLFACFPENLQQVIGYRAVKYGSVYNQKTNANLKTTADRLWLLSPNEIWTAEAVDKANSSKYYSHPLEGNQYPYFETRANTTNAGTPTSATGNYRFNNFSGSGSASTRDWWLRSFYGYSSNRVLYVNINGSVNYNSAYLSSGAAPCFSLSRSEIISDSLSAPSDEGNQFALYNEKKHSFDFSKVSAFDNSGLEGATFRLTGTSNYGTKVDVTATSQGTNGTVRFEDLESGVYTLTEIEAPDGYIKDEKQYPVIIYRNDTVKIEGMAYDDVAKTYKLQNIKKRDQEIVVTKVWHDKSNNMIRPMPRIILSTTVPQGRRSDFTVLYHAND